MRPLPCQGRRAFPFLGSAMNAQSILQHAYDSIAKSHPEKDAFQILDDVESLANRMIAASKAMEEAAASKIGELRS